MTVNNEPRISRSLELLGSFRQTVADFAAREEELTKDITKRRYAAERKFQNALKDNAAALVKEAADNDSEWKQRWEQVRSFHEARHLRLEKAERNARREMPRRIGDARGRWLGSLQKQKQRLEKEIAAELEAVDSTLQAARGKLAEQQTLLTDLTKEGRRILSGLPGPFFQIGKAGPPLSGECGNEALDAGIGSMRAGLDSLRGQPLLKAASLLPVWIAVPLAGAAAVVLIYGLNLDRGPVLAACGGIAALSVVLYFAAMRRAAAHAKQLVSAMQNARALHGALVSRAEMEHGTHRKAILERQAAETAAISEKWNQVGGVESDFVAAAEDKLKRQAFRIAERNERRMDARRAVMEAAHAACAQDLERQSEARARRIEAGHASEIAALNLEESEKWSTLETEWNTLTGKLWLDISQQNAAAARLSAPWSPELVAHWKPAEDFAPIGEFGSLKVDLAVFAGALPKDPRLALPCPVQFEMPLALTFPHEGSLLMETREPAAAAAAATLNHLVLRLLATTPPGRIAFTIFDPAGLGAGFAGLMHLADYEDALINRRIWTQREQMEERLGELNAHIEKVIQMYLRNDYATITEYNEQAGSVAEKYHFLVIADFPSGFSEIAVKRLQSIVSTGPRCGVYTLIHWDQRLPRPDGLTEEELRLHSVRLARSGDHFILPAAPPGEGVELALDAPPAQDLALELIHRIGQSSIDSSRVQVPFSQIAPPPAALWTGDTTTELRIAIGRTGATKHQFLAIGKGTRQHALFAGKTGSGKSTLFHVIITNLALTCSPDQVEFYLIDFKKGVEFKCYATQRLPHARVVAIESDREFALSVLQRVDEELKRRGDLFRRLGVQDVAGFKRAGGEGPMPRTLLIIDEFQEFFVEDDSIAQSASLLFDRIVRQGRAFGIHVLLGSQTLGGAYSLPRATLGQMAIRVALQCNEADAYLIMDDGNAAPRLLSRPGEGIYNDASGAVEGNSPFQVVWLPDDERDKWLHRVQDLARERGDTHGPPIVFEGNAPASVMENELLEAVLAASPAAVPPFGRCWLGAPNSIKGPTEAVFHRQSGNHLLIVGQRDEAALTMLAVSARALAAEYPPGTARFYFVHGAPEGSVEAAFIARLAASVRHGFTEVHAHGLPAAVDELATELKARSSGEADPARAPAIFVFIHGLHRFKKLRQEDDFRFGSSDGAADTGTQFNDLICEGSSLGIHLIPTVDTFNNVNRSMSRKALSEFEMRVVFQMSANDSSSLIDSPAASTLGLHRAILYNEHAGTLETFRPYAAPPENWWTVQ